MVSKGDKVWIWHFGSLKQIEVAEVTEISNQVAVLYAGFAAISFFATRHEAIEHRLVTLCSIIESIEQNEHNRSHQIRELIRLAKETRMEI